MPKDGTKTGKASMPYPSASQPLVSVASEKNAKCKLCDVNVTCKDPGIECEICENWFHIKCEDMSQEEYDFLIAHKSLHWYCTGCNKSVATTIKLFNSLKQKVDNLEERLNGICDGVLPEQMAKVIDDKINVVSEKLDLKVKQILSDFQGLKDQVSASETKLETAIEAKLVDSVDSIKKDLAPSWASMVNKEVTNQFERVSKDVSSVQSVLDDTHKKAVEEREKESRVHNIIIYRVAEVENRDERVKEDKTFCLELFNSVLGVEAHDGDFISFRLGKRDQNNRPLMVKFKERTLKNRIMENMFRLKDSEQKFKNISVTHDLTLNERGELKTLLEEAKKKQSEETGEYLWRVRGLPGQLKLIRLKKN